MGDAKRRAAARAEARPYRQPRVCPVCKSTRIVRRHLPAPVLSHRPTHYDLCRDCRSLWEAYPDDWCEDVVGAEPCDNCAFSPDSPEQRSPDEWRALIAKLRAGGEFRCHKGCPILGLNKEIPNADGFYNIEFDPDWIERRGRTCAGFMRMVWALRDKGEDWLAKRYGFSPGEPE